MSRVHVTLNDESDFTGVIALEKFNAESELIDRKIKKSISLYGLIEKVSNKTLSLGDVEINLDFDKDGQLVQIEIYK